MAYKSPFEAYKESHSPNWERIDLGYNGTLGSVLTQLSGISENEVLDSRSREDLIFHPPRIVRAFVNYKISDGTPESEELLRGAIRTGLDLYSNPSDISKIVESFRHEIPGQLLELEVKQESDRVTALASDPSYSRVSLGKIRRLIGDEDILLIALAHGGVPTGMDIFLRYADLTKTDSEFYVAPMSRRKKRNAQPDLTKTEIDHLQDIGRGKRIIIFDEDAQSHRTINGATEFFKEFVFPKREVISRVNFDSSR